MSNERIENLPEVIIFDWDNTIIDSWAMMHKCLNRVLEKFNKEPWSLDKVKNDVHASSRDFFPEIFGDESQEAYGFFRNIYQDSNFSHLSYIEDVEIFLSFLFEKRKEERLKLVILSNKQGDTLRAELKYLKIDDNFDIIVGAGDCEKDKPSPIPVEYIRRKIGASKDQQTWFIGDSIADIECAHRSGCVPILFGEKSPTDIVFSSYPPAHHFTNYHDFYSMIKKLR